MKLYALKITGDFLLFTSKFEVVLRPLHTTPEAALASFQPWVDKWKPKYQAEPRLQIREPDWDTLKPEVLDFDYNPNESPNQPV